MDIKDRYFAIRQLTEELCAPLEIEDCVVQPIEDVSPVKWHMGHTTWVFEKTVLSEWVANYRPRHCAYDAIFGDQVERSKRGTLSRPTLIEIVGYRREIDDRILALLDQMPDAVQKSVLLGLQHEQQHQELMIAGIKCIFGNGPLRPAYTVIPDPVSGSCEEGFIDFAGGAATLGCEGDDFSWGNEAPAHTIMLGDYRISKRLVTNREYLEFIEDGGYSDVRHWLSDGWESIRNQKWSAPLYWMENGLFTLGGLVAMDPDEPVSHISYYEADAFARWKGLRLPTEGEWENAARRTDATTIGGNFLESGRLHPRGHDGNFLGNLWEWTSSPCVAMDGSETQRVLRGGSCATPRDSIRITGRNGQPADKRWQFTGLRLAE